MDSRELEYVNNLIDRKNIACHYKDKYQAIELTDYFDRMHENEFIQAEIKAINFFSELNHLRRSRRTEFNFHNSIIDFMRQEFNPTAPGRIEDCVRDLLSAIAEYKNALKGEREPLNPVLFGALLCYQLFTISPYEEISLKNMVCKTDPYMFRICKGILMRKEGVGYEERRIYLMRQLSSVRMRQ